MAKIKYDNKILRTSFTKIMPISCVNEIEPRIKHSLNSVLVMWMCNDGLNPVWDQWLPPTEWNYQLSFSSDKE